MRSRAGNRSTGIRLGWVFAIALVAVAAGCSSLRMGYNHADTLLLYTFDDYLDLNAPQQRLVRDRVRALLAWHRQTQLRGYAELIESAGKRLDKNIGADEVLALNLEMNRSLVAIGDQASPDLAELALTLQPAQLARFAGKLAEDNAKTRRELASSGGKRSLDQRAKRSVERAQEWFGSVSPQQDELIRNAIAARPDNEEWWVHERERRRSDLLVLLQRIHAERPNADDAAQWLREYFALLSEPQEPERRAHMNEYRRGNAELIAALVNAASAAQKGRLFSKLHGYADDFVTLASSGVRG